MLGHGILVIRELSPSNAPVLRGEFYAHSEDHGVQYCR